MASMAAQPVSTSHPRILGIKEVMWRIGRGRSTVYRLGKTGILPQAKRLPGCTSAGWHEDVVDAVVESLRPDIKKPAIPAGSAPAKSPRAGTRNGIEDSVATAPVATPADFGTVGASMPASDLVPTTLRIMGNVVYLHPPTRKLLLEVGNLSGPGRGVNLDTCAIAVTADETVESAATALLHHELEVLAPAASRKRHGSRNSQSRPGRMAGGT